MLCDLATPDASQAPQTACHPVEVWKIIPTYGNDRYEASTKGRVRNKQTRRLMKPSYDDKGYLRLSLRHAGVDKKTRCTRQMHHLVAVTFLANTFNKPTVNHKNHIKDDNNVSNLEWATVGEQNRHKRKQPSRAHYLNSARAVWQCDMKTGDPLQKFDSVRLASIAVTGSDKGKTKICAVALGRFDKGHVRKSAYGYKWEYIEDPVSGEIWKDIDPSLIGGVSGYQLSTNCRIRNHKGRVSCAFPGSGGPASYHWFSVHPRQFRAHVLMARVFLPNFFGKRCVNHKDGNKSNNRLWNLEYATDAENGQHAHDTGLNQTGKAVLQIASMTGEILNVFPNVAHAARVTGVCKTSISKVANGQSAVAGTYRWQWSQIHEQSHE